MTSIAKEYFDKIVEATKNYASENPKMTVLAGTTLAAFVVSKGVKWWNNRIFQNTILEMDLSKIQFVYKPIEPIDLMFDMSKNRVFINDIFNLIYKAAQDPKISGLYIRFGSSIAGIPFAQLEEFRQAILTFNSKQKLSVCYAESYDLNMYYFASAFSKICIHKLGMISINGKMAVASFLKNTFGKLNIEVEGFQRKKYKTFVNQFTEDKFTKEHFESSNSLLESVNEHLIQEIAKARNVKTDEVKDWIDQGMFFANKASEQHLVDVLADPNEMLDKIEELTKSKPTFLYSGVYSQRAGPRFPDGSKNLLAIIYLTGQIHEGESVDGTCGSDTLARAIRAATKNEKVKGIIMRVDSPGGSAIASEIINKALLDAKKAGKVVVISMGSVAASGGYWVSMNADSIICNSTTITGSIGVAGIKLNIRKFYSEWLGITFDFIESSKSSTMMSNLHSLEKGGENEQKWNSLMDEFYDTFTTDVSKARKIDLEKIKEYAQGKVYTGNEAKKLGLIDEIGGFETAISVARKLCKIDDKENVSFVRYPKPVTLLSLMYGKKAVNSRELEKSNALAGDFSFMSFLLRPFYTLTRLQQIVDPLLKQYQKIELLEKNPVQSMCEIEHF